MARPKCKVVLVANCQARPLAKILTKLNPNIDITAVAIVHLLQDDQEEEYRQFFDGADFIVTQLIADNYPCSFVRTSLLKGKYSEKIITIVNVYYSGYNPELMYIRNSPEGTLKSPLLEYHNKTFLHSWEEGKTVSETISRYNDFDYNKELYSDVIDLSMQELKKRESIADIKVTDIIGVDLGAERKFFTFNHPCMSVMIQMCARIIEKMGAEVINQIPLENIREDLDKIIVPVNVFSREKLQVSFADPSFFKGVNCAVERDGTIRVSGKRLYSVSQIIEKYFEIYDVKLAGGK